MNLLETDLANLKQLYSIKYGIMLTDEEVKELAQRLIILFRVIGKKLPES